MRKQLKSIATAILAVAMLMSISVFAMAVEQDTEVKTAEVDDVTILDNIYSSSWIELKNDKRLTGGLQITEPTRTVQYKIVGKALSTKNQPVTIKFKHNIKNGEEGTFSTVADGQWHSKTYSSAYPSGSYSLIVQSVGKNGDYALDIIFLP